MTPLEQYIESGGMKTPYLDRTIQDLEFVNEHVRRIADQRAEAIDKFLQKNGMTVENAKEFHLRVTKKNDGEKIELFRLMPA